MGAWIIPYSTLTIMYGILKSKRLNKSLATTFQIAEHSHEGLSVFDQNKEKIFSNNIYESLGLPCLDTLLNSRKIDDHGTIALESYHGLPPRVRVINHGKYYSVHALPVSTSRSIKEKILEKLLHFHHVNPNIFIASVQAIGTNLPWKWVGISRFLEGPNPQAKILALWEKDSYTGGFDKNLANTACEQVAEQKEFIFYSNPDDLKNDFPNWPEFSKLNAHCYAGLPYLVNGQILGHIFFIHDDVMLPTMERSVTSDVIYMVSEYISAHLELETTREKHDIEKIMNHTDQDTGLKNKFASKEVFSKISDLYYSSKIADIAIIKLVIKNYESLIFSHPKEEVSTAIRGLAEQLRKTLRTNDHIIRWNDGEFIILIEDSTPNNKQDLDRRIENFNIGMVTISPTLNFDCRLTFVSYFNGNINDALESINYELFNSYNIKKSPPTDTIDHEY